MKISVVMPVHNSGKYYKEAMESLFGQTFREFEIICVDDASEDFDTQELLQEYEKRKNDIPVSIIRLEESKGAAEARNIGFKYVRGEYVIFLDSDDIFTEDFLEKMYEGILQEDADVCVCGAIEFFEDNEGNYRNGREYNVDGRIMQSRDNEDWLSRISTVPWDKLCKTEFLKLNNIYFQSLSSHNDVFFSCMVMACANKVHVLENSHLIRYRVGTKIQISANRSAMNLYYVVELLLEQKKILVSQCCLLLLCSVPYAIERCKNISDRKQFYNAVKKFFKEKEISFTKRLFNKYKQQIIEVPYEEYNYLNWVSFEGRLNLCSSEIKDLLLNKKIILWGNGKRGKAFQKFCVKYGIDLFGVVDKVNERIGEKTEEGFLIMKTEDIQNNCDCLIVASNHSIYEELDKMKISNELVNLELFC